LLLVVVAVASKAWAYHCTLTLELTGRRLRSQPVTVQVAAGRVTPDTIIFELQSY